MISLCFSLLLAFVAYTYAFVPSSKEHCPKYITLSFTDSAKDPKGLEHIVNKFRAALGDPDNGNDVGPLGRGRREVSWG